MAIPSDWQITLHNAGPVSFYQGWGWNHDRVQESGYHFWYLRKGHIHVRTEHGDYDLRAGDMYIFRLNERHWCSHDPADPFNMLIGVFTITRNQRPLQLDGETLPYIRHFQDHPFFNHLVYECVDSFTANDTSTSEAWFRCMLLEYMKGSYVSESLRNRILHPALNRLVTNIFQKPGGDYSLDALSQEAGYSKNHIINLFKSQLGATPSQYVIQVRVNAAKQMLLYSDMSVAAIGQYLGYKDTAYFSRQFKAVTGYPPLQYRNWVGMDATV